MNRFLSVTIVAAALLLLASPVRAQDCSTWSLWTLRGSYTFSATGWQDLSVLNPALPKGYAPVAIVGAFKINGEGDLAGWATINVGGVPVSAQFVNSKVGAPKADCSVPITLAMKVNEWGGMVDGPYAYSGVIAGDVSAPEIDFMMLGTAPGAHVDLNHAKRVSVKFE